MNLNRQVIIGGKYRHPDKFGTEYVVDNIIIDATSEEETGKLGKTVIYTQTKAGIYPVGTQYARSEEDFLSQTTYEGKTVNKFELIEEPISQKPSIG